MGRQEGGAPLNGRHPCMWASHAYPLACITCSSSPSPPSAAAPPCDGRGGDTRCRWTRDLANCSSTRCCRWLDTDKGSSTGRCGRRRGYCDMCSIRLGGQLHRARQRALPRNYLAPQDTISHLPTPDTRVRLCCDGQLLPSSRCCLPHSTAAMEACGSELRHGPTWCQRQPCRAFLGWMRASAC